MLTYYQSWLYSSPKFYLFKFILRVSIIFLHNIITYFVFYFPDEVSLSN